MDIALVFPGCHRRGGVERSVWEAARWFGTRHQVTVYASDYDGLGLPSEVRHVRVPAAGGLRMLPMFSAAVTRLLEGSTHDHVLSFGVADVPADVLWVNSVHRAWLERSAQFRGEGIRSSRLRRLLPHHRQLLALERRYFTRLSHVSLVVVVADAVAADLERLYHVPPALTRTVHNGFDPQEFSPKRRLARAAARNELGLPDDATVLLMVANELPRKGYHVLLDAVARLGDPAVHVLLVGRTPPDQAMTSLAQRLGIDDRVHYGGSQADMGRVHAASDLFVLPTKYEAFCLAIVESLGSGLPVVTTTVPGAGDVVREGVNGFLQRDPSDAAELAAILRRALVPATLADLRRQAAPSVADLTWSALFERAEALLCEAGAGGVTR